MPTVPKAGGFTITSSPKQADGPASPSMELAIQNAPGNQPAEWLWGSADKILGSELQVRVGGSFVFPPPLIPVDKIRKVVFVAGGVGINPLMSMMSYIAETNYDLDVQVAYASKVPSDSFEEILFFKRITGLFEEGKLKGKLQIFATGLPDVLHSSLPKTIAKLKETCKAANLDIHANRITPSDLQAIVGEGSREGIAVYVCGPPTMTDELIEVLTSPEGVELDSRQVLSERWW